MICYCSKGEKEVDQESKDEMAKSNCCTMYCNSQKDSVNLVYCRSDSVSSTLCLLVSPKQSVICVRIHRCDTLVGWYEVVVYYLSLLLLCLFINN